MAEDYIEKLWASEGIYIPEMVFLDDNITPSNKFICGVIYTLGKDEKCYISNKHLAKIMHRSIRSISRGLTTLINLGYIENIRKEEHTRALLTTEKAHIVINKLTKKQIKEKENPYGNNFTNKLKDNIKKLDGYVCRHPNCYTKNTKDIRLIIHHIDLNKKNNIQANLISICKPCHGKMHGLGRCNPKIFIQTYFYSITQQ